MEVRCSLKRFKPWGQAVAVLEKIEMANKLDALESYLEDLYGDTIDGSKLNDLLAYENEDILAALGLAKPEEMEESFNISKMNKLLETALNEDLCYVFDFEIDGDTIYCKNEFGYDIELDINEEDAEDAYIVEQEIEEQMDEEANNIAEDDTEITGTEIVCFKYDVETKKGSFELVIFTEDEDNIDESLNEDSIINKFKKMVNKIAKDFKEQGYPKSNKYLLDFVEEACAKFNEENKDYLVRVSTDNDAAVLTLIDLVTEEEDGAFYQARINGYGKGKVRFTDLENSNYAYESLNEESNYSTTVIDNGKEFKVDDKAFDIVRKNLLDVMRGYGWVDVEQLQNYIKEDGLELTDEELIAVAKNCLKYTRVYDASELQDTDLQDIKDAYGTVIVVGNFKRLSKNESLNEGKLWYIGWRSNPQLKNGGYWKKFGQLTKAEAKKWEKPGYGDMSLTGYETEEEYNKALEEKGLK